MDLLSVTELLKSTTDPGSLFHALFTPSAIADTHPDGSVCAQDASVYLCMCFVIGSGSPGQPRQQPVY